MRFAVLACLVCVAGARASELAQASPVPAQHEVDQGIAVDFSALPAAHIGDPTIFAFTLTDTASGTPISGARPAAWLVAHDKNTSDKNGSNAPQSCKQQVATYLSADLFRRADIDLNSYYVLSLNDDNSISVVDPLFGFGGSKLLAMLPLPSRAADWALATQNDALFVTMPTSAKVAIADTRSWKIVDTIAAGPNPRRIVLQADRAWIADDEGLSVIDVKTHALTRLRVGAIRELATSNDGDLVFATGAHDVLILDAHAVKVLADIVVDGVPDLLAYSSAAKAIYAADALAGRLFAIDVRSHAIAATVAIRPGATQLRFAPDGRHALMPNPQQNAVQVLDAASNRIVQSLDISNAPVQVSFTSLLAYVRRRTSETVAMIPLDQIGVEGRAVGVADFPAGQHALGDGGLADSIVGAPDQPAVLVVNTADNMIYYYKEGMAAPAGGFNTYGATPRAVLVVDHGLREQQRGRYATAMPVKNPGAYDVVMFVDAPRVVACFGLTIAAEKEAVEKPVTRVTAIDPPHQLQAGAAVRLQFALSDVAHKELRHADDVRALAFEAPGVWQRRGDLKRLSNGNYELEFIPPTAGTYYVWIESDALGLARNNSQFSVYQAIDAAINQTN
ncbi:hypothetical protein ELE36_19275 [Pseudolysobacter antarcticus]|uniref:Cytochrome D1 n=1 Tax=Pseudolysobacter antarcticus TaxID=2511995 RepID=A0A411HPD8_9GAMM|nr:cytochrome D1 domain-containing protein [Pseudolysobacter antarcticus]QBB72336.1 hypothetical protein ELE36_19275 [Pseudolysobacter antarcticus]